MQSTPVCWSAGNSQFNRIFLTVRFYFLLPGERRNQMRLKWIVNEGNKNCPNVGSQHRCQTEPDTTRLIFNVSYIFIHLERE